jgi:hypothetical protein
LFKGLNEAHAIMTNPYYRTMFVLSYIKGPNVDDWVAEQVEALNEKVNRQQNPILWTDEQLWNDFNTKFTADFTDTAKEQVAHQKLMALKMFKDDIDSYIATFGALVKAAGYDCNAKETMHLFAQGLRLELLRAILYSNTIPDTIENWEKQACEEIKKNALRDTMLHPNKAHYRWQFTQHNGGRRHHPNDETVPMDIDPPVFTQINCTHTINKAYTDDDKRRHHAEGRCFNCSRIRHMAKECPMRKSQASQFRQCHGQATMLFVRSFICIGPSGLLTARVDAKLLGSI